MGFRFAKFCRAAAVAGLIAVLHVERSIADDSRMPLPSQAAIHSSELKARTYDLGRNSDPSAYAFAFLAACLKALSLNDLDRAINACTEAVLVDPQNAAGYKLRGMAYFEKGQHYESMADFDQAIVLDPHDAASYAARGAIFRARGETRRALDAYTEAIALQPSDGRWWNARCWTRATARIELGIALADCDKAVRLTPRSALARDSRGLANLQLGRNRAAIKDYTSAIALDPLATSYFGRGVAKVRVADWSGYADLAKARVLDRNIDRLFRGYGIVVPSQLPREPARNARSASALDIPGPASSPTDRD